jgi:thiamine biosynthesis lipoprotein
MYTLPSHLLHAASADDVYLERAVFAMGTTVSVSAFGESREHIIDASSKAFGELYRLDRLLSVYRSESDIGRMNASSGRAEVHVHQDTREILSRAKRYHTLTAGAFDVTVEPLMERWGFRDDSNERDSHDPSDITIGIDHVHVLANNTIRIDTIGVKVDLGGIAVGYTVDRMAEILRSEGVTAALINHGGDIYALGRPAETDGWNIIIPHPDDQTITVKELTIADRAISTSSNSQKQRRVGGRTVGHIVDPRTRENPHQYRSMSVLSETSCEADVLSTAMFVQESPHPELEVPYHSIALRSNGELIETQTKGLRNNGIQTHG